jgi:hypothetical protein
MNELILLPIMKVNEDHLQLFTTLNKIIPSDKKLLAKTVKYFRPNSKNYEDSWGYIIQATRYGGFKWYDPDTGSLIFFGRKSDTDPTLVIPNFFATPKYLANVVKQIQKALKAPRTILKNIDPDEIKQFIPYGFHPYNKNDGWNAKTRFDDQTFPQPIIDLRQLFEGDGKKYYKLRNALYKNPHLTIRKYRSTDKAAVLEIFALKDGNMLVSSGVEKGMFYASHVMYPTASLNKFVVINNDSKEMIGFIALSDISPIVTTAIASIFKPESKNFRVWCEYQILVKKYQKGFQLANLGGSEYEGDYHFKVWTFRPTEELEKTHLVFEQ